MSRLLDDLNQNFKPVACELIARSVELLIPVMIVYTRRTMTEQLELIKSGQSWTVNSRHLTGHAIDICPFEIYQLHGKNKLEWDSDDPVWQKLGAIGKQLGCVWGGNWSVRDMGHFEKI